MRVDPIRRWHNPGQWLSQFLVTTNYSKKYILQCDPGHMFLSETLRPYHGSTWSGNPLKNWLVLFPVSLCTSPATSLPPPDTLLHVNPCFRACFWGIPK